MSDQFQKLLGDLTVQYMLDVQELRDEVIKLRSEKNDLFNTTNHNNNNINNNSYLMETSESSEPSVQDSGALEGETAVPVKPPIYQQQHQQHQQQHQQQQQLYQSEAVYGSEDFCSGLSEEDCKFARLDRALTELTDGERNHKDPADEVHHCTRIANFLQSDAYEMLVGCIILTNVFVLAAAVQVQGSALGYSLDYPGYSEPSSGWQQANKVFFDLDLLFMCLFTVDLIMRTSVLHIRFFKKLLNWVDLLVVIGGWMEIFGSGFMDPFFVRMLRLVKFGRAFRAMQLSKVSHSLKILGKCITASVGVLFWSLCLLFIIQCIGGMMLSILVRPFMEDTEVDPHVRRIVFRYYGTFSSAMLTMFEVLFANWPTACRILTDNVSEWFGLWFIVYRCLVGFAVLNVVNACFVQQTMSIAQQDTELILFTKENAKVAYGNKLRTLFRELDTSGDGIISWEEFAVLLTDDRLRSFLSAMEIDASDMQGLFEVLGDGSGNISADEFVLGARRINGPAKSVDMVQLLSMVKRLDSKLESSATCFPELQQRQQERKKTQKQQHHQQRKKTQRMVVALHAEL
ncbi:unnamed protein product [Polarella glacialis]|uniref:EF-hand domain-containing protein n=1 Tax=Polarella glacialis TaxID=89957 RepID=A0A813FUF0_POLGL|nr:unnamed protein product [Polarella glacialis]